MSNLEEEIYSTMFSSLKHPVRRKILRMLYTKSMTFSQLLEELSISSSHLTYHLESLGELLSKTENGEYKLSTFGIASVNTMQVVEEAPVIRSKQHRYNPSLKWKAFAALLFIGIAIVASLSYTQYEALNKLSTERSLLEARYEQLLSWNSGTDEAIDFLRDVIQIDITKYHATLLSNTVESRSDLGGVVEEILRYSLTSSESKLDVIFRFRNNALSRYQLYLLEGSPIYQQPQPEGVLDASKNLIQRYRSFNETAYLRDMNSIITSINSVENIEATQGNIKLKISKLGNHAETLWLYTQNGVDFSPKSLSFVFENGDLKELTDGWFLWEIGSTNVNISNDEAIQIAKDAVVDFTWKATNGVEVAEYTVVDTLVLAVFHPTPREEPLTLVPYWYVTLHLDGVYPDGVKSLVVGLWADTGEVVEIKTSSD